MTGSTCVPKFAGYDHVMLMLMSLFFALNWELQGDSSARALRCVYAGILRSFVIWLCGARNWKGGVRCSHVAGPVPTQIPVAVDVHRPDVKKGQPSA